MPTPLESLVGRCVVASIGGQATVVADGQTKRNVSSIWWDLQVFHAVMEVHRTEAIATNRLSALVCIAIGLRRCLVARPVLLRAVLHTSPQGMDSAHFTKECEWGRFVHVPGRLASRRAA